MMMMTMMRSQSVRSTGYVYLLMVSSSQSNHRSNTNSTPGKNTNHTTRLYSSVAMPPLSSSSLLLWCGPLFWLSISASVTTSESYVLKSPSTSHEPRYNGVTTPAKESRPLVVTHKDQTTLGNMVVPSVGIGTISWSTDKRMYIGYPDVFERDAQYNAATNSLNI